MTAEAAAISKPTNDSEQHYAALDFGSNSFHMIVAREVDGNVHVLDRLREPVRLASGLDRDNELTEEAIERALACITRFAQRLREFPSRRVRAVGTNTLRKAGNARTFLTRARKALGHPIEVIAGREEARLIYLGVVRSQTPPDANQLVVDIGGGSTEFIIGRQSEPIERESLYIGCVAHSRKYFGNGKLTRRRFVKAEIAARIEIAAITAGFKKTGWSSVVGSSGTIKAIAAIAEQQGWSQHGINATSLEQLQSALIEAGHIDRVRLNGLVDDRRPVLAGGLAVLQAIFAELGVEEMQVSAGALREGLLYDLIGRSHHEDVRPRTVQRMAQVYGVDQAQADRVAATAARLFESVREAWGLGEDDAARLTWAAQVHEIGLSVAHTGYHKHAEYIVRNADMPGFSRQEQALIAFMIRVHRRKFHSRLLDNLPPELVPRARRLAMLLRLAVLLHRARTDAPLPALEVTATAEAIHLRFPEDWLERFPLTLGQLEEEQTYLQRIDFALSFT